MPISRLTAMAPTQQRALPDYISRLNTARRRAGHTQESLAQVLGITLGSMRNYLAGRTAMRIDLFVRACEACGVDAERIIRGGRRKRAVSADTVRRRTGVRK